MSLIMLKYHRANTYLPSREGRYLVWHGQRADIARWDNRRWYATSLDSEGRETRERINGVTHWAFLPTCKELLASDPSGIGKKYEIRPEEVKDGE